MARRYVSLSALQVIEKRLLFLHVMRNIGPVAFTFTFVKILCASVCVPTSEIHFTGARNLAIKVKKVGWNSCHDRITYVIVISAGG